MHLSSVQWKRRILKLAATKSEGQREAALVQQPVASLLKPLSMAGFPEACVHTENFGHLKA